MLEITSAKIDEQNEPIWRKMGEGEKGEFETHWEDKQIVFEEQSSVSGWRMKW